MKSNRVNRYSNFSSFEDFRREKEMLKLRGTIIETKLSLRFSNLKQSFSGTNILFSVAKEFLLPGIAGFFGRFSGKTDEKDLS